MPISSEAGRQWLSTRTDQEISWAELCIPTMDYSPSAHSSYFSQEELVLPDQDTTRELMRDFFRSSFRLNFPVLEQVLFEKTMQTAYEPVDSDVVSPAKATARACVLGALSIVARSDASHQNSICIDADACSAGAYSLLMHLTEDISLETLQVVLLLVSSD
jgi:hypothetical protein